MYGANGQGEIFLCMLLCGCILGVIYSCLYVIRFCFRFKIVSEIIFDLVFAAAALLLSFAFLQKFTGGEVRFFMLAGIALGFVLIRLTYFKLFKKSTQAVYNLTLKIYRKIRALPLLNRILK